MKHLILSLSVAAALAGCAGNGGVTIPDGTAPIPPLTPADSSKILGPASTGETPTTFQTGNGQLRYVSWAGVDFWGDPTTENRFIYQASNGRIYTFDGYTDPPNFSDRFAPDNSQSTRMIPQVDAYGNKLLVCCEKFTNSVPAAYVRSVRYGAWIGANGQNDLFVGGILANPNQMQNYDFVEGWEQNGTARGKATYEVWAFRIKDGAVVSSSYNTNTNGRGNGISSLLTANFNTGQIGGVIKGNSDFGADITFNNVNINGNTFSGSVMSGGESGQVNGGFYGKTTSRWSPHGTEIGGKIVFDGNHNLDSVFGGSSSSSRRDARTDSTDLNPINP